ncbi:MAG: hypothetical protein V4722_23160 [Bacteroidota bacterium]
MKRYSTVAALMISFAAAAQTNTGTNDPLSRAGMKPAMEAIKKMDPQKVKQQVDSICKLRHTNLLDETGKPLDIAKAIAANNILLMNGEVYYLPTGASTIKTPPPTAVKPNTTQDPLKRDIQ